MFRKIVSNLPFSPALVEQLGFYAKRLKKEETTRRLGLIFIALALAVQSLAVFQPSESANASSLNDMVTGGITSINDYLSAYDSNTKNLKDTISYVGITRAEIAAAKYTEIEVGKRLSWGFVPHFSYDQGERQYNIIDANGQTITTAYSRPLKLWDKSTYYVRGWVGYSQSIGWFGIMRTSGNLVTDTVPSISTPTPTPKKCAVNPNILASDENCKSCTGNETLWFNDSSCIPNIVKSKVSTNSSQGFIKASKVAAKAGDQISYSLTIENSGLSSTTSKLEDNISDVLEYTTLIDNGGGTLNENTGVLSWSDVTLKPKDKQTRTYTVKVLENIPLTAQGLSNDTSYDCKITNTFGNSIDINVDCPTPKVIEKVAAELPKTGPTENMVFIGIVLSVATYFYTRTRQVKKEIRLIRRDTSAGTI